MEFPSKEKPKKLPLPKEHQYLIWLLKKPIADTRDELEDWIFIVKLYKKVTYGNSKKRGNWRRD